MFQCTLSSVLVLMLMYGMHQSDAFQSDMHSLNMNEANEEPTGEPSIAIPLKDQLRNISANVFQRIRPFVYPASYRVGGQQQQHPHHASMDIRNHRNITPLVIQPNATDEMVAMPTYTAELHGPVARIHDVHSYGSTVEDSHSKYGAYDVDVYQQPPQPQYFDYGHRHGYTLATTAVAAPALTSLVGGVLGLLNPIVLMTLWLVVCLVNSLLNVVDHLNLTKATKLKMDKMESNSSMDRIDDKHSMNDMVMASLEKVLRMTYELYDNRLHQ